MITRNRKSKPPVSLRTQFYQLTFSNRQSFFITKVSLAFQLKDSIKPYIFDVLNTF